MSLYSKSHPVGSCVSRAQEGVSDNKLIKSWISHPSCRRRPGADHRCIAVFHDFNLILYLLFLLLLFLVLGLTARNLATCFLVP